MSGMNYNRPQFQRQRVWQKHDQFESFDARRGRERQCGNRYRKLDLMLFSYDGSDDRLAAIRAKRYRNEDLSNRDQAWAFERLRTMESEGQSAPA